MKTAIINGVTGAIGSEVLNLLLQSADYLKIIAISRTPIKLQHSKLENIVIDFRNIIDIQSAIKGDVFIHCLGTTMKQTPDVKEYKKIEVDYPIQFAEIAAQNKVAQFIFISSIGASFEKKNRYLQNKGLVEKYLKSCNISDVKIIRPSLLVGRNKHKRLSEQILAKVMTIINPFLFGKFVSYKSIKVFTVAKAIFHLSLTPQKGCTIYEYDKLQLFMKS